MRARHLEEQDTTRQSFGDTETIRVWATGSGATDLLLEVVIGDPGEPSWAHLSQCND